MIYQNIKTKTVPNKGYDCCLLVSTWNHSLRLESRRNYHSIAVLSDNDRRTVIFTSKLGQMKNQFFSIITSDRISSQIIPNLAREIQQNSLRTLIFFLSISAIPMKDVVFNKEAATKKSFEVIGCNIPELYATKLTGFVYCWYHCVHSSASYLHY